MLPIGGNSLQPCASGSGNSEGIPTKRVKLEDSSDSESDDDSNDQAETTDMSSNDNQEQLDETITADDLTNPDGPSDYYWQISAEKDQEALDIALKEQEMLRHSIEQLQQQYEIYKQMFEEANSVVEVFKEEIGNSNDDTGIDVNDVSTADETQDGSDETLNNTFHSPGTSKNGK